MASIARPASVILRPSRYCLHSTARSFATSLRSASADHDASPARAHRQESQFTSGGPDLDPLSKAPRNSSTQGSQSSAARSAERLADLTQGVQRKRVSAAPAPPGSAQPVQKPKVPLAPSGYSLDHFPIKSDPTLEAFVNNLMKDGKKASATRHVILTLKYLAKVLHADPLPAFQAAILTASPLVRMQSRKQGGKSIQVPLALREEQGRRRAIVAIINASKKRGDKDLSVRLAKEIIAILEGTSSTIAKKEEVHRFAMLNRGNTSVRI